jgi:hypothetical protein
LEQLHSSVKQLAAPLSPDQTAFIQGTKQQQQQEKSTADVPLCFGAGFKFRIEPCLPTEAELAYLARTAAPPARHAQLTFSLEAVQAAAAAAAGSKRPAEGIGVDWLEKLIVSFYGDEKPLGKDSEREN